jgi:hypothetical protein
MEKKTNLAEKKIKSSERKQRSIETSKSTSWLNFDVFMAPYD